ncbi:MAG: hypothetical protein K0R82_846 [Flavipsychrobacter sp.]|jgi:hypothetical protein|nr:hypothetical protein [Flavipsychrobacter sp.]
MKQVQFDMDFTIDGKHTVCGFKTMEDEKGQYILMCATTGDYTREYELRSDNSADTEFHFVTPDVPEELKQAEAEISEAIVKHIEED